MTTNSITTPNSGGVGGGLCGLLGTAFVVLKLCHVINWSWLWVLAPFWLPLAIGLAVLLVFGIGALFVLLAAAALGRS